MKGRKLNVDESYDKKRGILWGYGEYVKKMRAKEKKEKNERERE